MLKIDPHWPAEHTPALRWAAGKTAARRVEPIAQSGWSSTYCLIGPQGKAYLKLLPEVQRHQIPATVALARRFRTQVPAIIDSKADEGWLLVRDHRGVEADTDDDYEKAARSYGRLQGRARHDAKLLGHFETIDLDALWPALREFLARPLNDKAQPGERVGGSYFMGQEDAGRYLRLLDKRAAMLRAQVEKARCLPPTLDHGDLNGGNLALGPDGQVKFIDWDDAIVGPAGLSLHSLFGGCVAPTLQLQCLAEGRPFSDEPASRRLLGYLKALESTGYADRSTLLQGLPGAMCAGQMRFIAHFGRFPGEGQRAAAGMTIRRRLSNLLDLCDWLASRDPATALSYAEDYEGDAEWGRAARLVQDVLARTPQTPALLTRYGMLSLRDGEFGTAEEAFREALKLDTRHHDATIGLAKLHMARLDLGGARGVLADVLMHDPGHAGALALRERVEQFDRVRAESKKPQGLGRLTVSAQERAQGHLEPETLALVIELFKRDGAVQLDEVFDPEFVRRLQKHFDRKYGRHFHDGHHPHALRTGDKRYMLTLELDDTLGRPELIASGLLLPFVREMLGDEAIMTTCTAVISLPGSQDQRIHKDFAPPFEEKGWKFELPCWSLQAIVPLVALDETTGATAIWKGSQRKGLKRSRKCAVHDPVVPLGSVLLVDYKTAHGGRGNRSRRVRPILCLAYGRPWFRDVINHRRQPPMRFAPGYVEGAPQKVLDLVGWWDRDLKLADVEM